MTEEHDVFSVGHNSKNEAAARDLIEKLIKRLEPWLDPFADEESRVTPLVAMLDRSDELLSSHGRMPPDITTAELATKATDHGAQIATMINKVKKDLKVFKAPFWDGGKDIDGFVNVLINPLEAAKGEVEKRLNAYQKRVAEEARIAAEAEAKRQREAEEAARKAAEVAAAAINTEADFERAIKAEENIFVQLAAVYKAQDAVVTAPQEAARIRGAGGALATVAKHWIHRPETIDRDKIDLNRLRPYLPLDGIEQAIRQFIKAGGRELAGVVIEEAIDTRIKSR